MEDKPLCFSYVELSCVCFLPPFVPVLA